MMDDVNVKVLEMLAAVVHCRRPMRIGADEWPAIRRELRAQTVLALPADYIKDMELAAEYESAYTVAVVRNMQVFHALMLEQDRVLSVLEAADVPVVVIKGAAAAVNYPHPENRCMGDIDLLVRPQDFHRAFEVLVDAGFVADKTPDDFFRHIRLHSESNIEIELHYHFSCSDNHAQNEVLDAILYLAISSRVIADCEGYSVSMLPPVENGLVLLSHINQHLSTGLGLRQIIDWMMFVEKYVDDEFWQNGFADLADRIGMKRLAIITTAMCQKYLGLHKDIHWACYEPVCDELMNYILSRGNFGKKEDPTRHNVISILQNFHNPLHGFATMQRNGLHNWKATKKHPWLRPFAWCYQLIRWLTKGIKQGVNADILVNATSSAQNVAELIEKLGVTRL